MDAPLVALVAHGNDALAHGEAPELLATCTAFRQIGGLDFAFADGDDRPPVAGSAAWLEALAARGVTRLDLVVDLRVTADASAFPGGLGWELESRYDGHASRWSPEWRHDEGARLPFHVAFSERRDRPLGLATTADGALAAARERLDGACSAAQRFNDERGLPFGWRLADARTALHDEAPRPVHQLDVLPPRGFPLAARQLVAAADRGWVFGGLGAWNDRSFEDEEEQAAFERISTTLLHALIVAVVSGTNAYLPPD